jgi:hypothetical protein
MDDLYRFCSHEAIFAQIRHHFQRFCQCWVKCCILLQNFLLQLCSTVWKLCFSSLSSANGVHVIHPVQEKTGGSRTLPDLGCEQDGKRTVHSIFCDCFICVQAGVRPGIVV